MATITDISDAISGAAGLDRGTIDMTARLLREAGYLPNGKAGRGGVDRATLDPEHAAALLVGITAPTVTAAAEVVQLVAGLPFAGLWIQRAGGVSEETTPYMPTKFAYDWHKAPFLDALAAGLTQPDASAPVALRIATSPRPTATMTLLLRQGIGCIEGIVAAYAERVSVDTGLMGARTFQRESAASLPHPTLKHVRDLLAGNPAPVPSRPHERKLQLVAGTYLN